MRCRQGRYMWDMVGTGGIYGGIAMMQAVRGYLQKREVCIAVELKSRPTIRVVSRLYSERTKPCPIANEKALTSWSNRSNEFLRPVGFDDSKWRASGTQLAAKSEH